MGICGSTTPPPEAVKGQMMAAPAPMPPTGGGKRKPGKFQIKLSGRWQDYDDVEDKVLKRAFLIGQNSARFHLRGQDYEYNFRRMKQKNLKSKQERDIRPPRGLTKPPAPILPPGSTVIITVPSGSAGKTIEIDDPNNQGKRIAVNVPAGARAGQKMAVPVPEKGQNIQDVCKKQKGWSTGAKTATGLAAIGTVGVAAVGGALVGDHLAGGTMAVDAANWVEGAADAAGDWGEGAADAAGDWGEGALDDIADFAEDAGDWLGDAAEDAGDWVMSLF